MTIAYFLWIILMKSKFEVSTHLKNLVHMLEKQFGKRV